MKVLVACEESQAVTIELRKLGHEAYSCDIQLESGGYPEWHIQGDVLPELKKEWDMIIAFPPCTHLAVSGAAHFEKKRKDGRQQEGIDFFMEFTELECEKVVIENPVGIMSTIYREPNQIIQPYWFGDEAQKSTCLWLKGLPLLVPTNIVGKGDFDEWISAKGVKKRMAKWYTKAKTSVLSETSFNRSKTFPGISKAMAYQFTHLDDNDYYYKFNQMDMLA